MEVIFLLIGFSLVIALLFLAFFIWSVRSGQFDDLYTPSIRMLFDNPAKEPGAGSAGPEKNDPEETSGATDHPHR